MKRLDFITNTYYYKYIQNYKLIYKYKNGKHFRRIYEAV